MPAMIAALLALIVSVTPARAPQDVPLHIRITALRPLSTVRVGASIKNAGSIAWISSAWFRADARGVVDLRRDAPLRGSYTGVHPMGLIWSMHDVGHGKAAYFSSHLSAYTITATSDDGHVDSRAVQRLVMPPRVTCADIAKGLLLAYVCRPSDGGRHAGIILLGGSEGGEQRRAAALFAEHGYAAMALAYFQLGPLPQILREIPVETVGRGLTWFARQPFVDARRIGVWGGSKGGEFALLSAAQYPQIHAAAILYGSPMVWYGWRTSSAQPPSSSWTISGKPLPFIANTYPKMPVLPGITDPRFIPIEKIHGPILLVAGDRDKEWPSVAMAQLAMQRLHVKKHAYRDRLIVFKNAGHGFTVPYYPAVLGIALGGTIEGNAAASVRSWQDVLAFFADALH